MMSTERRPYLPGAKFRRQGQPSIRLYFLTPSMAFQTNLSPGDLGALPIDSMLNRMTLYS